MRYKLSDICSFRKGKVEVNSLNRGNYVSTENMLINKGGKTEASSLPNIALTQEFKKGDVLVSNSYYSQQEMKGHGKNTMLESVF